MRFPRLPLIFAATLAAMPLAAQQGLVCPTAPAGRACEAYHYHVQHYRPENKQFVEILATPQFATQAACERARDARVTANLEVVEFFHGIKQTQYPPDRYGPCHCDMTNDKSSATFLGDAQRTMQMRTAEEIRLRVRERLLDEKLPSGSEVVRGLDIDPPVTPQLGAPKLVPMPQIAPAPLATSADDLKATRTIDTTKPAVAALDLPLVDILPSGAAGSQSAEAAPAPEPVRQAESLPLHPEPPLTEETVIETPAPAEPPAAEPQAEPEASEEEMQSAQDTAERFVSYETQRIQNVLKASTEIADESVKSRIFEACMQRIQLLSNLRLLIEGSGMRSRLAMAAREAESESERLALIAQLFGEDITTHWAPKDATDVILDVDAEIASAPDRALRDASGRFSTEQKKRALYLVLARMQPTEDQRLWLSTVVEGFLR
jgi:hypothetical protein